MSLTNTTPLSAALSARKASRTLARLSATARNEALSAIHAALSDPDNKKQILAANARDLTAAQDAADNGILSASLVKRLDLGVNENATAGTSKKWEDMVKGLDDVRRLDDPCKFIYFFYSVLFWELTSSDGTFFFIYTFILFVFENRRL